MADNNQDINQLLKVRREKLAELQEQGNDPFTITKYDVTAHTQQIKDNYEQFEGKDVSIAGRMMSKRVMGKASFCNIQDRDGNIQCYVARDSIGEDAYKAFKKMDIGDIVGIKGTPFTTKTGEKSVHVAEITLLSKSLQILPEKFHGLTNTDIRYRQRYVDLIMNPEVKDTFIKRSKIIKEIRNFLDGRDFMEVETPMLVSNAGGAAARPFETHYNALDEDVKLRISLELYLKRLIVGGLERVYEIGRVFRNEGVDTRHNPEFTLMELYQAYTDYEGMMELTESMFRYLAEKVCGSTLISYNGTPIDLGKPFARLTMIDAIKQYAGIDFDQVKTDEEAKALADQHKIEVKKNDVDTTTPGKYEVTYKVTDNQGASFTKSITVTVNPKMEVLNEAPVIHATDKTITVGDTFDPMAGVTATDAEDGNLTTKIEVKKNDVDTTKAGKYEVTYKVTDNQGATRTKTITVTVNPKMKVLNEAPTIDAADKTITVGDTFDPKVGVTAKDAEDGDLTDKIEVVKNTVDTKKAGKYEVTYKVTDSDGATRTKTIKVTVKEKAPAPSTDKDKKPTTQNKDKDKTSTVAPKTGDTTSVNTIIALLAVSGIALLALLKRKKVS